MPAALRRRRRACWRTDAGDHGGDAVTAMAYAPSFEGLPGGDGHAGWLVTASAGLLNLWECSASGGRGEASLTARALLGESVPAYLHCVKCLHVLAPRRACCHRARPRAPCGHDAEANTAHSAPESWPTYS